MAERDFQDELGNGAAGCADVQHFHKLPDNPIYAGMKTRFHPSKPYDCMMVSARLKGRMVAVELKQARTASLNCAGREDTPGSGLQFHQEKALLDVVAGGG